MHSKLKPLSSRSRSLKAHQENVKNLFAVWPVVVLEAARLLISQKRSSMKTDLLPYWVGWGRWQSKQLFGKEIVNIVIDKRSKSEKKIGMQPGEVAGLIHVGMDPRFSNQSKYKDRRHKHKENDKISLRLTWREGWKIIQSLEQHPKIKAPN